MIIGVPKEIKLEEHRIGLTPESVKSLTSKGHKVILENNGGYEAGFTNNDYKNSGAEIVDNPKEIFKNSEIIVPARTFFSSASCIVNTGNKPVFADVDLNKQNITVENIKKKITKKTKAIICVHLAGLPCDMYAIKKLANKHKLKIIEDCSQAHGASINNKSIGSFSHVSTWSFCNDKIISTLGEGGMISTNSKKIFDFCKRYINHGTSIQKKINSDRFIYNKNNFGTNLRITEIQSCSGLEQLKDLKKIQRKREKMSKDYFDIILKYKNYFESYYPPKQIKSAWYRFYFFIKTNVINYKNIRLIIIKNLKKKNLKCFTGSCPEIYLEKSFKKLKGFKQPTLKNCKVLGDTSIALDINHTLNNSQHKKKLIYFERVIKKIFQKNEY